MSLNPAQRTAVDYRGGPILVLAGAGTGKTRVITHRVAALLDEGIPPWRILAVTFTNKAAGQMRDRITALCEDRHDASQLWVGTFHSTCARILRRFGEPIGLSSGFTIYDTGDQASVMKQVLADLNVADRMYTPRGVLGYIDRAKNRGLGPEDLEQLGIVEPVRSVVRKAFEAYQRRLLAADAADFGDLLSHAVELLRRSARPSSSQLAADDPIRKFSRRFLHIVVDEFQDTNPVQAELVDRLSGGAELCVVGDDDQAIYGWRGADVAQILGFPDRHAGTEIVRLEQNYRSTSNILDCADAVIRRNSSRLGKTLWSELGEGDLVRALVLATEREEARFVAREVRRAIDDGADAEDFAVFYRTHAQSRVIEDEIRQAGMSCRIVGGVAFYERAEIKDVLSYLIALHNSASDTHVLRILNRPARGIGATSQNKLVAHAAARGISLWEALSDPVAAGLGRAPAKRVAQFRTLMADLAEEVPQTGIDRLVVRIVDATGYREVLATDGTDEAQARLENLQELLGNVEEFVQEHPNATLADYLETVSLAGGERAEGDQTRAITLMTIHAAKGLEFEHVYLTGMEERVFPHARVLDDPVALEEERRLAYVALTRAKTNLTLTMAGRRRLMGQTQVGQPSRFLLDLPRDRVEGQTSRPLAQPRPARGAQREPDAWQDDIEYDAGALDPTDAGEGFELYVGMVFRHAQFGDGELLGWSGHGGKLKLELRFPGHGKKTVMARFCEPL